MLVASVSFHYLIHPFFLLIHGYANSHVQISSVYRPRMVPYGFPSLSCDHARCGSKPTATLHASLKSESLVPKVLSKASVQYDFCTGCPKASA